MLTHLAEAVVADPSILDEAWKFMVGAVAGAFAWELLGGVIKKKLGIK